jgi:HK97 gp10 family phage protein
VQDAAREAVAEVANVALEEARRTVPVVTGALRDSLHIERDGDSVEVVADAGHAAFVEFGTSRQAAEPFLTPALAVAQAHIPTVAGRVMAERLD